MASVHSGYAPSTTFGGAMRGGVLAAQQRATPVASHAAGEQIRCLAVSRDVAGLVALGCESVVMVLALVEVADPAWDSEQIAYKLNLLHTFVTGTAATAICFSARTGASDSSRPDRMFVELCVGCSDRQLRILTCTVSLGDDEEGSTGTEEAVITPIPALSQSIINAISYCRAEDFQDIFAYCSDDGKAVVVRTRVEETMDDTFADSPPIAGQSSSDIYVIPHAHPVLDLSFHEAHFKSLATYDATGSIRLWDWYESANQPPYFTLVNPKGLARTYGAALAVVEDPKTGLGRRGGMAWRTNDSNVFGAVSGTQWLVWDTSKMGSSRPQARGEAFFEGADRFRWCPTNERLFAVSSASPDAQPAIKIFSLANPRAPRALNVTIGTRNSVGDIQWHPSQNILFAAVGHQLLAFAPE